MTAETSGRAGKYPRPTTDPETQQQAFALEQARLRALMTYATDNFKAPPFLRRLLPRDGVNHAPWAYYRPPTYASLHADQTRFGPSQGGTYKTGLDYLTALGREPLRDALAKGGGDRPNKSLWLALLEPYQLIQIPDHIQDAAAARQEQNRLVGLFAAVEGMGFNTDLAFAAWQHETAKDVQYSLVPYDAANELHGIVAGYSPAPIADFDNPGLVIRYAGGPHAPGRTSINVCAVDINRLRAQPDSPVIGASPDPAALARQPYELPNATPSTHPEFLL